MKRTRRILIAVMCLCIGFLTACGSKEPPVEELGDNDPSLQIYDIATRVVHSVIVNDEKTDCFDVPFYSNKPVSIESLNIESYLAGNHNDLILSIENVSSSGISIERLLSSSEDETFVVVDFFENIVKIKVELDEGVDAEEVLISEIDFMAENESFTAIVDISVSIMNINVEIPTLFETSETIFIEYDESQSYETLIFSGNPISNFSIIEYSLLSDYLQIIQSKWLGKKAEQFFGVEIDNETVFEKNDYSTLQVFFSFSKPFPLTMWFSGYLLVTVRHAEMEASIHPQIIAVRIKNYVDIIDYYTEIKAQIKVAHD